MQTVDVLEPDKPQIDPVPLDVVLGQCQFLGRFVGIGIGEIELRLIDEQLDRLRTLGG